MGYDKDIEVRLENVNSSQNLNFSMPIDYFWNGLNEDSLLKVAMQFVEKGFINKVLKQMIDEPADCNKALSSTNPNILEFKEMLINLSGDIKNSYSEDMKYKEMVRWWKIGRAFQYLIETIMPERKITCTTNPHDDDFYIFDNENNKDDQLCINILDMTYYVANEKTNGKKIDNYIYELRKKLNDIIEQQKSTSKWNSELYKENEELKKKLKKYEK